jgi:hypothetical protein
MILGTSRIWWIAAAVPLVLGFALLGTGTGGTLGAVAGILLIIVAIIAYSAAPMRYGRATRSPATEAPVAPAPEAPLPPGPRPEIEARDASDV